MAIVPIPAIPNPLALAAPFIAIATSAEDVVGVFDQDFNQVLKAARSMKANVVPELKKMTHPIESGAEVTDFKITLPTRIELAIFVSPDNYQNIYNEVNQYFRQGELLNIQTRASTYPNQMIVSPVHEETPEFYNSLVMVIKFEQVQIATTITNSIAPIKASDSNTVNRGNQQSTPATAPQAAKGSFLFKKFLGK